MRILLIAPDTRTLNSLPEIVAISSQHQTTLLVEQVTVKQIYDTVRYQSFDVLHFATHTDHNNVYLSETEILDKEQLAQIARTAGCSLVFFNGCDSAGLAAYLVRHGVTYAIYTTNELNVREAWQMPNTFYALLSRPQHTVVSAYTHSDGGEGLYGLIASPEQISDITIIKKEVEQALTELESVALHIKIIYILKIPTLIASIVYIMGHLWLK